MSLVATKQLQSAESRIEKNLQGFYEVGKALAEIRDDKLYHVDRGGEFETFDAYCKSRWGWERTYVHYITNSAEAVDNVHHGELPRPDNERQARELLRLETPAEQKSAWKEAVETAPNGKVTAAHVREVVNKRTGEVIDPEDVEIVKAHQLPALGSTPHQQANEDAARRWAQGWHDIYQRLNSIRDIGGFRKLMNTWDGPERASNVKQIRRVIDRLNGYLQELESEAA